jgi:hypothetical protein
MPSSKLLWSEPVLKAGTWLTTRGDSWARLYPETGHCAGWTRRPYLKSEPFDVPFDLVLLLRSAQLSRVFGLQWDYLQRAPSHLLACRRHGKQLGQWLIDSRRVFEGHLLGYETVELQCAFQHGRFQLERLVEKEFTPGALAFEPPPIRGVRSLAATEPEGLDS